MTRTARKTTIKPVNFAEEEEVQFRKKTTIHPEFQQTPDTRRKTTIKP